MAESSGVASNDGGDEFDYEDMMAGEVVEKLEEAWQNEKLSPDLLHPKTELLECIFEQIKLMEENLSLLSDGDFVNSIHKLEIDRIKFVVCSYIRTRLHKIEKYVWHFLEKESSPESSTISRLSTDELSYAKEFSQNFDVYLKEVILQHLPTNFQQMDKKKTILKPNMDKYVFIRALERRSNVAINPEDNTDSETIDLEPNSQYVLPYQPVSLFVLSGIAKLV